MNELEQRLGKISVGEPAIIRNLAIFPLFSVDPARIKYLIFSEALKLGVVRVTEVSEGGQVPRLVVRNEADEPVLLLDGEELVGCKQNRIVNLTILAPAHREIRIPVSCVEQGRWRFDSSHFEASNRSVFSELRAEKVAQVSMCLDVGRGADSDQHAIWQGLHEKARRMGSDSSSGAMGGIYRRREADVDDYLRLARLVPGQVGAVFAINGRVVGLELFDAESTFGKYAQKVTSGYALDAIDHYTRLFPAARPEDASAFVERVVGSRERRFDGVGLGTDIRLDAPQLAGAALAVSDRLVHLCAFDLNNGDRRETRGRRDHAFRRTTPVWRPVDGDVEE